MPPTLTSVQLSNLKKGMTTTKRFCSDMAKLDEVVEMVKDLERENARLREQIRGTEGGVNPPAPVLCCQCMNFKALPDGIVCVPKED